MQASRAPCSSPCLPFLLLPLPFRFEGWFTVFPFHQWAMVDVDGDWSNMVMVNYGDRGQWWLLSRLKITFNEHALRMVLCIERTLIFLTRNKKQSCAATGIINRDSVWTNVFFFIISYFRMKLVFGIFFLLSGIIVATDLVRREGRKPKAIKVIRCSVVLITPLFLFFFLRNQYEQLCKWEEKLRQRRLMRLIQRQKVSTTEWSTLRP